jgi:poly-beta-1,6-N-acetyl-D-glucosamine synthase
MSFFLDILFLSLGCYILILVYLALGFFKTKVFVLSKSETDSPFTIIICARNEERYMARCLTSVLKQEYNHTLLQIILVNDASTDSTLRIAKEILNKSALDYSIISNASQKGKKQSILDAIQLAKHPLIITRDADTYTLSDKWLKTISAFYQKHSSDMIIAPVALGNSYGLLWALQAIENNILALAAAGSANFKKPFLCSGANLIFTKKALQQTNNYASHLHIASGDDVLFLEDLKRVKGSVISYLKSTDAIVYTFPCYSLKELINQKIRWASKVKVNKNGFNLLLAVISTMVNFGWLFCLLYGFLQPIDNSITLVFIISKLLIDFLLLFLASGFIKNRYLVWFSLPIGFVYPIYACIIAISSLILKPTWK